MKSINEAAGAAIIGLIVLVASVGTVIGGDGAKPGDEEGPIPPEEVPGIWPPFPPGSPLPPYREPVRTPGGPWVPPEGFPGIDVPVDPGPPVDCGPPGECHYPCMMGPSCPICMDIGCHPPGFGSDWNEKDWNVMESVGNGEEGRN